MWCRTLSVDGAARLLTKLDIVEAVVSYACDVREHDFALEICRLTGKPADDVHLKIAMDLEDEEKVRLRPAPQFVVTMVTHTHMLAFYGAAGSTPKRRLNSCWPRNPKRPS